MTRIRVGPGFAGLAAATLLVSCTSVVVSPLDAGLDVSRVCIVRNEKVTVPDFLEVLREGFDRHGIATRVVAEPLPEWCEVGLSYTALRSWDFATYLSHAELWLRDRDGRLVASAEYHLRAKGGLSLTKWQSTETKMAPVIDELLAEYRTR